MCNRVARTLHVGQPSEEWICLQPQGFVAECIIYGERDHGHSYGACFLEIIAWVHAHGTQSRRTVDATVTRITDTAIKDASIPEVVNGRIIVGGRLGDGLAIPVPRAIIWAGRTRTSCPKKALKALALPSGTITDSCTGTLGVFVARLGQFVAD